MRVLTGTSSLHLRTAGTGSLPFVEGRVTRCVCLRSSRHVSRPSLGWSRVEIGATANPGRLPSIHHRGHNSELFPSREFAPPALRGRNAARWSCSATECGHPLAVRQHVGPRLLCTQSESPRQVPCREFHRGVGCQFQRRTGCIATAGRRLWCRTTHTTLVRMSCSH